MNLGTEDWIPVVWKDGRSGPVSLRDAFRRGDEIHDLAVRPHERIALMRLLICIAQAGLDGPEAEDDRRNCRCKIAPMALTYLDRWRHAFELFGDGPRFLQVSNLSRLPAKKPPRREKTNFVSKLDMALATGHNPTLFDNAGGTAREFPPAALALMLLTFQCFSPSGSIGVALWDGEETPRTSNHAPCLADNMLHALLRGDSLSDTLHRNLLSKDQVAQIYGADHWGKPVWEAMPRNSLDSEAIDNANGTYLGRIVPLSRAIRLADDLQSLILANAVTYRPYPQWREPTATVIIRTKSGVQERKLLRGDVEKGVWRELHALTVKTSTDSGVGGPIALKENFSASTFDLWVGSLIADQGKLNDVTESVFHVPGAMLDRAGQQVYEEGVKWAEKTASRLDHAVSTYYRELGDNLDLRDKRIIRQHIRRARTQFWSGIENSVTYLLDLAAAPEKFGRAGDPRDTMWGQSVSWTARAAYDDACPRDTSWQIQAYVNGVRNLLKEAPSTPAEKEGEA